MNEENIFIVTPDNAFAFFDDQFQMDLRDSIGSYLMDKESGNCFWIVTDDIDVISNPFGIGKRVRAVVPTNRKEITFEIIGVFLFCPEKMTNAKAISRCKSQFPNLFELN